VRVRRSAPFLISGRSSGTGRLACGMNRASRPAFFKTPDPWLTLGVMATSWLWAAVIWRIGTGRWMF
jgi:hypothetical protein